jgi:precorrin-2 dehydrogenase/sirohydrochlorin ferrochelatase
MRYYPLFLDLRDRKCLVIGGGKVAERKARSLLKVGALVQVISPNVTKGLGRLEKSKRLFYLRSVYQKKYLRGAFLAVIATNDSALNAKAAEDARRKGILTNVVDSPLLSDFIVPSLMHKGALTIAISTNGKAPALSKRMRRDLQRLLVTDYAKFLLVLEEIRSDLRQRCKKPALRRLLTHCLVNARIANAANQTVRKTYK